MSSSENGVACNVLEIEYISGINYYENMGLDIAIIYMPAYNSCWRIYIIKLCANKDNIQKLIYA